MQKLYWNNAKNIEKLMQSLRENKISITSTDTIYGFLCTITKAGYYRLKQLKGIVTNKPFLVLISGPEKLKNFIKAQDLDPKIENLLKKCWPGPLTLIFKAKKNLPDFLTSKENNIGIRCPRHEGLLNLLQSFDGLFSTSANKSGKKATNDPEKIDSSLLKKVKYLVTEKEIIDRKASSYKTFPSTILDVSYSKKNIIKVVREGKYKIEELEEIYGSKFKK